MNFLKILNLDPTSAERRKKKVFSEKTIKKLSKETLADKAAQGATSGHLPVSAVKYKQIL